MKYGLRTVQRPSQDSTPSLDLPKGRAMSQLSRPYQIALAAFALVAVVWFAALRGHHGEPNPTPTASTPSPVDHGSTSTKPKPSGARTSHSRSTATTSHTPSHSVSSHRGTSHRATSPSRSSDAAKGQSGSAPARQASLQHELSHGKVVVLLFWNPKSTDDQAVRDQLHVLSRRDGHVAIHVATPAEVTSFGGYTRGVQVSQTPTALIINAENQITTLSGLTDARSIQQTIGDALKGGSGEGQFHQVSFAAVLHGTHLASREKFIAKAESMCKSKRFYLARTKKEFAADLSKSVNSSSAVATKARFIKLAPTADRPYISYMFGLALSGIAHMSAAFSTSNAATARILLFHGQQELDQAYNGLESYGIDNCVVLSG
jgi:hypothetical protein